MTKLLLIVASVLLLIQLAVSQSSDLYEDARLTTTELLRKYGYPAEEHSVTTQDGYILELHRCPGSPLSPPAPGKPVIFVMHGMLSSSADFVIMGPQTSLAYMLADAGYDVWMGNARGNRYSTAHVSLSPTSSDFWRFSWHEVGIYDLTSSIDYVLAVTGKTRLHYVGHSQGTTVFWVMASEVPAYNDKIISMHALAAAAYMHNTKSPYVIGLTMWLTTYTMAFEMMGVYYFEPSDEVNAIGGEQYCKDGAITQSMCSNVLFLIAGYDSRELNTTMLPVIMAHSPAGASTMQMIHFGQVARAWLFRKFDFGALNFQHYGQLYPPLYNLARVRAPVFVYHSANDWMATPMDVQLLVNQLPNVRLQYLVPFTWFNHLDFVWAINVRSLVYDRLLQSIRLMDE